MKPVPVFHIARTGDVQLFRKWIHFEIFAPSNGSFVPMAVILALCGRHIPARCGTDLIRNWLPIKIMKPILSRSLVPITSLLLLAGASGLQAANGTWTADADGIWSDTTKWSGGTLADGSGYTADFSTINITADRTVTLDASHTLTTLKFGDVTPDHNWILSGANTLTLAGTTPGFSVVNQTATISSIIAGTAGLTKTGAGTLDLNGSAVNTYSGATTINAGTLLEDFSNLGSTANLINSASALKLGGGTLQIIGNSAGSSQTFASTAISAATSGQSVITASGSTPTVNLGTLTGLAGGLVKFIGPAYNSGASSGTTVGGTTVAATAICNATANTLSYGILAASGNTASDNVQAYATVGLYDWAALSSGTAGTASTGYIVGGSQITGFYTVENGNLPSASYGLNVDLTANGILDANSTSASASYGTIRFNANSAITLGTGRATGGATVGGLLVTPNVGLNNITISQGTTGFQASRKTAGAYGLTVWQNNILGELVISAVYQNGSSSAATATYSQGGSGSVFLSGANTYTGQSFLDGGYTVIGANSGLGAIATGANANINGGTLFANATFSLDNAGLTPDRGIVLNGAGGTIAASAGNTLTVDGAISGTANLNIGTGTIAGTGAGTANTTAIIGSGTVVFSSGGNTYSGVTTITGGATLNINSEWALGGGNYGGLTFNNGTLQYAATLLNSTTDVSGQPVSLVGNGTIDVNGNAISFANSIGNSGSGALTVKSTASGGVLNLSGANTYTGGTTVSSGTLNVNNTSGSGTGSGDVTVNGGALGGSGTISGNVTVNSGAQTLPGSSGVTTTIGGNLTYNTGSSNSFYLGSSATGGGNDQIVLSGAGKVLTCGSVNVGINCGSVLDQTHDYVLFNLTGSSASISGTFNATPVWLGSTPGGAANYSVVVSGTQVVLHYAGATPPAITAATASPNPVLANQTLSISATVTPGSGTIDPSTGVTVNLASLNGSATQPLIADGLGDYTNTVVVGIDAVPGSKTLQVTVTDSLGGSALADISLTVNTSTMTWNGADTASSSNWSDGANWASGLAPGFGDDLSFAGGTGLSPVMDNSYSIASVTFASGADSFNISNSGGSVLTLTGGVTNNSANAQTLSVPVVLNAPVTVNAAAGGLALAQTVNNNGNLLTIADSGHDTTASGAVSGGGGVTMAGSGTATLSGVNTYTGNTTISSGTLAIGGSGQLGGGTYAGAIANNGTLTYDSTAAQTLSGVVSGTGVLNQNGSGTLTLSAANAFGGATVIANGSTLQLANSLALQNSTLNYSSGTLDFGTLTAATLGGLSGSQNLSLQNDSSAAVALTVNNSTSATYTGTLSGSGSLSKVNTGTLTLSGAAYSGNTIVYNAGLVISSPSSLTSHLDISAQQGVANVVINGATLTSPSGLYITSPTGGSGTIYGNAATLTITNGAQVTANADGNGRALSYGAASGASGGERPAGNGSLTVGTAGDTTTLVTVNGALDMYATSGGSTTGNYTVNLNGGTLAVKNIQETTYGTHQSGTFNFNGGILKALASDTAVNFIASTAAPYFTTVVNSGGAIIDANGYNITIATALTHGTGTPDGGLTVFGGGTLTLTNANTYTGPTMVTNGRLLVNGSLGSGAVTATNATLGGAGTIGGATTLQPGSILAPGSSGSGTLTFSGNLTLDALSTNTFVVTTAGGASNKVVVAGALSPNNSVVSITTGTALHPGTNTLFTYGTISGSFNPTVVFDVAPVHPASIVDNGSGQINLVVPNSAPVAGSNFTMGVTLGTPATVQIVGGKYSPTDADGDALTITSVSGAVNGTVTTDGTNITYTAVGDASDSFIYTVSDGYGGTASQTVNVTINTTGQGVNQLSAQMVGGNEVLGFAGIPNYQYALEWTHDLTPPVTWTPLVTNTAAGNGILQFTNTPSSGSDFYRTRYVPVP
jgi:fibronectin-binding autotransporter adhesin